MNDIALKQEASQKPRVIIIGLASCFGCQLQITNIEAHLLDVLGQIDLQYWQLASSDPMPDEFDVAVIEGAVTTEDAIRTVQEVREKAQAVITIGACSNTAGIPGMAAAQYETRLSDVYSQSPNACGKPIAPRSVPSVIPVDHRVPCCPIDSFEFLDVLSGLLHGTNKLRTTQTMCADCKKNETTCFYNRGKLCLGMVTLAGCGARCVNLGRPCNGCRGLSPDANLESARESAARYGVSVAEFDKALEMFNETNAMLNEKE